VSRVPGVDGINLRLQGAARNQRVIDRPTDNTRLRGLLDRGMVFVGGQCDERKAFPDVLRRVDLRQAVRGAAIALFVSIDESFQTSLVMLMVFDKDRISTEVSRNALNGLVPGSGHHVRAAPARWVPQPSRLGAARRNGRPRRRAFF